MLEIAYRIVVMAGCIVVGVFLIAVYLELRGRR